MSIKSAVFSFAVWYFLFFPAHLFAENFLVIEDKEFEIAYDPHLKSLALETARLYPDLKKSLEEKFGWPFENKATIVLIKDRQGFLSVAESPLTIAFAVPSKNLIVVDCSSVMTNPSSLELTLKHEMCHLVLHSNIQGGNLPRWLDEGTCQWVSSGFIDIVIEQKRSALNRAAISNRLIPFSLLEKGFPHDQESLVVAYEQSKSIVNHIVARFGTGGLLAVLHHLKLGDDINSAVPEALSISLKDLVGEWSRSVSDRTTWFVQISYHLYEILFGLTALIMVFASIKLILKKRAYKDSVPEDGDFNDRND